MVSPYFPLPDRGATPPLSAANPAPDPSADWKTMQVPVFDLSTVSTVDGQVLKEPKELTRWIHQILFRPVQAKGGLSCCPSVVQDGAGDCPTVQYRKT